ncbi:hypothetical protein ACDH67_05180 [Acinetobacter baumannii]
MIDIDHPFFFLKDFFDSESIYSLSKYVYLPDSLTDDRIIFQVSGSDFTFNYINQMIYSLDIDQELAFHSLIKTKYGKTYHIPMIDFSTKNLDIEIYYRLKNFIDYKILSNMVFFKSGNSFHAYSTKLLTHKEWLKFMGSLLLINPPNSSINIIDNRWIGHRIMSGYASLRWSNNSGTYKTIPHKTKFNIFR